MSRRTEETLRDRIDRYADRWRQTQGAERANYQLFLTELCTLLDLPQPLPQSRGDSDRNYCFEFAVKQSRLLAPASLLRIDLYRRGCFVLEAKQSLLKGSRNAWCGDLPVEARSPWQQRRMGCSRTERLAPSGELRKMPTG